MRANRAVHPVAPVCHGLGVSPRGDSAGRARPPSVRARADALLAERLRAIHAGWRGTSGAPRIHAELSEAGTRVGRQRVARRMRTAGVQGVRRRPRDRTTIRRPEACPAPDLVERPFAADGPDRLWVADITSLPTRAGFLSRAVVVDAGSRRVVGGARATPLRTDLVLEALEMALGQRRPTGVIHHSDQGSQSTSLAFGARCRAAGVRPSRGSVGDCYDNALCESVFATLECELVDRRCFKTHAEARMAVFDFLEGWDTPRRRHSALAYQSPLNYERSHQPPAWAESSSPSTKAG